MRVCFIQGNISEFSSQQFDKNLVNNGRVAPDEKNCDEPDYYVNIFSKYLTCSVLCRWASSPSSACIHCRIRMGYKTITAL